MNKKLTKKDHFAALLALAEVQENQTLVDFINHELELLSKKNTADRKPTAAQIENEGVKTAILAALTTTPTTISDLQKTHEEMGELSNQRISALLRQLIIDNKVVRTEDKKKALFALIG